MRYRYEIDEQNTIRAWDDGNPNENGAPFLLQDVHPDGRAWADQDEARAWVETLFVDLVASTPSE